MSMAHAANVKAAIPVNTPIAIALPSVASLALLASNLVFSEKKGSNNSMLERELLPDSDEDGNDEPTLQYELSGHLLHNSLPVVSAYEPKGHGLQSMVRESAAYVPNGHVTHAAIEFCPDFAL